MVFEGGRLRALSNVAISKPCLLAKLDQFYSFTVFELVPFRQFVNLRRTLGWAVLGFL